jgi:hypothetical protein
MAAPSMTLGTTLHTSATLAASGTATDTFDASTKFEAQAMYKVTAAGTVGTPFGVRVDVFEIYSGSTYGNASTGTAVPNYSYTVAGYAASQIVYSPKIFVSTGKWLFKLTNLDSANSVTVEGIIDTVDSVA